MGIKPNFTKADVSREIQRQTQAIHNAIIFNMAYAGEKCVNLARSITPDTGFWDVTGNLRSSIGYMVMYNGTVVNQNFKQVKDGAEGVKTGQDLARSVGSQYKGAYVLVVVAGMDYAVHVESRGKDVLTSAEIFAENEVPRLMAKLKSMIRK